MKKNRALFMVIMTLLLSAMFCMPVGAASLKQKNAAAVRLYNKKIRACLNQSRLGVSSLCTDLTGDGVKEVIIDYLPKNGGSGHKLLIYTVKNGKLKNILNSGEYGLEWIKIYKKTKSFVYYRAGHGGEMYVFCQYRNGKFRGVASKGRSTGAAGSRSWIYYGSKGQISKSKYNSITRKLLKGAKKKYTWTQWKMTT